MEHTDKAIASGESEGCGLTAASSLRYDEGARTSCWNGGMDAEEIGVFSGPISARKRARKK